jgi:glyoxylase-like metal-dependent hydrolase (beta-lactamase superfamily II)
MTPDQRTDRPSLGAIVGAKGTLLVEAGASTAHTELFLKTLAAQNIPAPRYAVLTHWHWDHSFGAAALGGIPLIGQRETARQLQIQSAYDWSDEALDQRVANGLEIAFCRDMIKAEMPDRSDLRIITPDIVFDDVLTVDLGDLTCEIQHVGGDHSSDSSIVYVPQERVVFLGDCHYLNIHHEPRYYTPERIFPLVERLLRYEADIYIEGHSEDVLERQELVSFERDLHQAHDAVVQCHFNRGAALSQLQPRYPDIAAVDWLVDAFIAGLALERP